MEESSEAHMDTGVSSTTDDVQEVEEVQEVQEVASTHGNIETVITVESIKEEEMSPRRNKLAVEAKSSEKVDLAKTTTKTHPELTIKKIIIKSHVKDVQIRPIQKSPTKSEEAQKVAGNEISPNKQLVPSISIKPQTADSSSKVEAINFPNKNVEKTVQSTTVNSSDSQKLMQKSPVKDSQSQDSTLKEAVAKNFSKEKQVPNKEAPLIIITKDKITKPPVKEAVMSSSKDGPPKVILIRDSSSKPVPTKESPTKQIPAKDSPSKETPAKPPVKEQTVMSSAKDGPPKVILIRDSSSKPVPNKESPVKDTPSKETPAKTPVREQTVMSSAKDGPPKVFLIRDSSFSSPVPTKESPAKQIPAKETPVKQALGKDTSSKTRTKETPAKEIPSKLTPTKETASKQTPAKETPAKQTAAKEAAKEVLKIPPKEQQANTTPAKESTTKTHSTDNGSEKSAGCDIKNPETSIKNRNLSLLEDKEASNDSQMEINSDISEKEHNKSISRELRSLINSAKESKIISECTQLTSKTRKSRTPLDTSLNASLEADKIQGVRRGSDNSQISNSSEKSDKAAVKRSMRSQNPEFVAKVKNFLHSVAGKNQKTDEDETDDESEEKVKENEEKESTPSIPKKKKTEDAVGEKPPTEKVMDKLRADPYCWRCHWGVAATANDKPQPKVHCSVCPRSFHFKCLTGSERNKVNPDKNWVCPECYLILQAESSETRSPAMKKISLGLLCELLKHALERMMDVNGAEPFMHPVDRTEFPDYDSYVVHPMDLTLMKQQIGEGLYGSTEAFLADAQWILHNSIIFNTLQAKLTGGARALLRSCRAEMGEIEACPECYAAAHARRPTWFTDVCTTPHILLWAKLKGFPYWPAKGMSVSSAGLVDVRFFGAHDRAWVPARDCFLFSEKDPNNFRTKRQDILDSMQEAEQHIRNISRKYGKFVYPPFKTTFDPTKLNEQIKLMIPSFEGEVRCPVKDKPNNSSPGRMKEKRRKSTKSSLNDGDTSEGEENAEPSRKMASGAEIAREEDDFCIEKDTEKDKNKTMEIDLSHSKENEPTSMTTRKRRRSELEEAIITIIDNTKEKRKRIASVEKNEKKEKEQTEKKDSIEKKDASDSKEQDKSKSETPGRSSKDSEPSTSAGDRKSSPKVTPVRVISIAKVMKNDKISTKVNLLREEEKTPKQKIKTDKANNKEKDAEKDKATPQEEKKAKRRNSNKNKSLNNSNGGKPVVTDKKNDKAFDTSSKDKAKINTETDKSSSSTNNSKSVKDRIQFDDDTSLAVLAREVKNNASTGLPTISSVRSLSTQSSTASGKSIEITVEATQGCSIFTPTSTDNVRNMKEAVNKLQKLRENDSPQIGRVGVRAFARMTSPPDKETRPNDVQVEIKAEPMDFEESEKQMQEKIDLMSAFKLRPVNPPSNLRDVRINKVVVTPVSQKGATPPQPTAMRAKKTFPQPKKPDEGRSELTSKNSMVYIPIQPPATQAPARASRPVCTVTSATPPLNRNVNTITSNVNNALNTITPPLVQYSSPSASVTPTNSSNPIQTVATIGSVPTVGTVPTVGQVPTTVHTMPLITSVNGQWTFSLQPVLSVGGVDGAPSPPMMNGIADRPALMPIAAAPGQAGSVLLPAAPPVLATPPAQPASRPSSDSSPGEPPRLQQRPALVNPLDANAPVGNVPPPSTVGPLTAKLNQNAVKMTDFFRTLLEDSIEKLDEPLAQVTALKQQLEQAQWRHQQEVNEIKHNHELTLAEMRSSFEKEKVRLVVEMRRQNQMELDAAVKLAKTKQWCANCNQEAQFYCCWNTAYCDYPCQRAHWATHYAVCAQHRTQDSNNSNSDINANPPESRLQPAPENLPKTTAAPNLAAANKLQPSRMYAQEQASQKASIIVSMVEDQSGNQTMKCVGTYKPPAGPAQMSPLIINKQIMSNEETAKKVVTSGGYLIVGASNASNSTTITSARRATAIQYIS